MKKIKLFHVISSLLIGLSVSLIGSYPALAKLLEDRAETQKDIIHLNQELYNAMINRDFSALQELLTNDFEIYLINGDVIRKQEWIKLIQKGVLEFSKMENLTSDFQGNQSSNILKSSGEFFGSKTTDIVVELNIRTIIKNSERQIKCIVVKEV